jgi:hypothetical protein
MSKRAIITVTTPIPTVEEMAREYGISSTELKRVRKGARVALFEIVPKSVRRILISPSPRGAETKRPSISAKAASKRKK